MQTSMKYQQIGSLAQKEKINDPRRILQESSRGNETKHNPFCIISPALEDGCSEAPALAAQLNGDVASADASCAALVARQLVQNACFVPFPRKGKSAIYVSFFLRKAWREKKTG